MKQYTTKDPLKLDVVDILRNLYRTRQRADFDVVESALINHRNFRKHGGFSRRMRRYGTCGVIRTVFRRLRFVSGPYVGVRALHPIPTPGKRQGDLKFADRMTALEWQEIVARHQSTNRSSQIKRDEAQRIVDDLNARGVETLEQAYGQMAIGL